MSISIFPVPSAAGAISESVTLATAYLTYKGVTDFPTGVYTVTVSPTTSNVQVVFADSNGGASTSGITASGTLAINVPSDSASVYLTEQSGNSNVQVSIEKTADSLSGNSLSGTLDTVTSTGTYNQTGSLWVVAVGGGGGGGKVDSDSRGGAGGGGGGINGKLIYANTSTSVTIGAAGNGATSTGSGNAGGATSFGNTLSVNGGGGGGQGSSSNGAAGTPGNAVGGRGADGGDSPQVGNGNNIKYDSIKSGTNGGGGGGGGTTNTTGRIGAGSGIGTGGTGGNGVGGGTGNAGGNATGQGAGGGGGGGGNGGFGNGGNGSAGVIYVLRGF